MSPDARPLTMDGQAYLIDRLVDGSLTVSGETADTTFIALSKDEVADLRHLALRLRRMALHERAIKKIVMGAI